MTKRELAKIAGNNLLNIRSQRGFTQDDVAEKAGISTSYYANLERGNKSMSLLVLRKVADALEVSTDSILYVSTSQSRLQNILSILRNKPESFIIGAKRYFVCWQRTSHSVRTSLEGGAHNGQRVCIR